MPPKSTKETIISQGNQISQPSISLMMVPGQYDTTEEEDDNATTTNSEDETTTQDSDCETNIAQQLINPLPPIQENISSEVDSESEEEEEDDAGTVESETEIQFTKSSLLEQLGTPKVGKLAPDADIYLLTGNDLVKFVRFVKYYTYGNKLSNDAITRLAIDIARSQQVVAPISAINTQDGELFVIDDVYTLMALRNLSDCVIEKLTIMLVVYGYRTLTDPMAKTLFVRLNSRQQFVIESQTISDIDQFMMLILEQPAFKDGIKTASANKKANFPHILASEIRKSIQEVISKITDSGMKADIPALANRLINFNSICKGKPISTLFGLYLGGSKNNVSDIDSKTRDRYAKMVSKDFYLASPYGRCWPQYLLGRPDTELVALPPGSSAPVIPTISPKFSFTLKKV